MRWRALSINAIIIILIRYVLSAMSHVQPNTQSSAGPLLNPAVHARITKLLAENAVVLFMKGGKDQPRCGFSAKATDVLNELSPQFVGIDVLLDEEIRQGIKLYSNWPTIPQLYINGELVGGSDIITQLFNTGELHQLLGAPAPDRSAPHITISDNAAIAIRAGMADEPGVVLHLRIDRRWQAHFQLAPAEGHEIKANAAGIEILMDVATAQAAQGMHVDWVESLQGAGLSIKLPRAPKPIQSMSVAELMPALRTGTLLIDVRPEHDRLRAPIPLPHRVLDNSTLATLEALDKSTPMAFLCHFGNSSRQAADHFRGIGFTELFNLEGGIDAYAREIDARVARY